MKKCLFAVLFTITLLCAFGEENALKLLPGDLYIDEDISGGYHLYIRKKPWIGSVLIAESTQDPTKKIDSYTLRSPVYNKINGDEKRIIDGEFIDPKLKRYQLIDSTPEKNSQFGEAFHIFIPYIVVYGYEWTRSGELQVLDGTFLNIMTFEKPYGDYRGAFLDNPYTLRIVQKQVATPRDEVSPPDGDYMPEAVKSFKDIATEGGGKLIYTRGKDDLVKKIGEILDEVTGETLEFVLAMDTTKSMQDDLPYLQKEIVPLLEKKTKRFKSFRMGLVLYRDYGEQYLTKSFPFLTDLSEIQKKINGITVYGGRDIPEAVYEALYDGIRSYIWEAESRLIILVGDAPPHPLPRGKITKDIVYNKAREFGIQMTAIILPQ